MILHPNPYLDTEFQVLNSICDISRSNDFIIFKSKDFPGYYDGNKLWFLPESQRTIKDWRSEFKKVFPSDAYNHVRVVVEGDSSIRKLTAKAKKEGYNTFENHVFMAANACQPFSLPQDLIIRELKGKKDWEEFYYHQKACHPENTWFLTEGLAIQKRTTEQLNIRWFGIFFKNNPKLLASLGIFKYANMARLQDVKTNPHHFRKGLATHLMRFALQYALMTLKVKELVLCADKSYHAYEFYKKIGFDPRTEILVISDYSN